MVKLRRQVVAKMGNHMSYYQAYTQPYTPENELLDTKIHLTLEENPKFQGKWMILRILSVSFQECSLSPTIMVQWKMDGLVRTQFSLSMIIGRKKNNMEKRTWLSGWNLTMGDFGVKSTTKWEYHYGNLYIEKNPTNQHFMEWRGFVFFCFCCSWDQGCTMKNLEPQDWANHSDQTPAGWEFPHTGSVSPLV